MTGEAPAYPVSTPVPPARSGTAHSRKLHLGHVAFMRAVVQGLDTRESWNRYLRIEGEHDDIRNVRRTVQWIRDEFAAAAKRHERYGTARLVRLDATRITDKEQALPSLEDFAIEHGLLDFSESEQLEYYEAHHGQHTQRQSRRVRVVARQLDALAWLEKLVAQPPHPDDPIASWLHPDLVAHLDAGGIKSVRQLVDRINGLGKRWWTGLRAIGAAKAERIMDWLHAHEASLGLTIGAHVHIKRSALRPHELARVVQASTAVVPLEKLVVPSALDGANGLYRAPRQLCRIDAKTDLGAVLAWIKAKPGLSSEQTAALKRKRRVDPAAPEGQASWLNYLSHTQRAYRKEAERFLLWAIVERRKALSSMTSEDCQTYRAFLANPLPAERWCGPRGREKWGPLWRPFEAPLSPRAQAQAITILKNLFKFLVDQYYLIGNPWNDVAPPKSASRPATERRFSREQWELIEDQLDHLPATSANQRLRFALHFFYATGLRLSEAVAAKLDHLDWMSYPGDKPGDEIVEGWELTVRGKGETLRGVPVPFDLVDELSAYLVARGLASDIKDHANRGAFLFGKAIDVAERAPWSPERTTAFDSKEGIATSTLYAQLKDFFTTCAAKLASTDPKGAQAFEAASTYWLRHTHGAHSIDAGVPFDVLQQNLGHASLNTIVLPAPNDGRRRMQAVQAFWAQKGKRTK